MDELAGGRRSADSPPPLLTLPNDLLREILLRLPPEPIHLFRASLVSKHWRGLVHDAGFLRRFRDFHGGTPPVLGFFNNHPGSPLFVSTAGASAASAAAQMSQKDWWALDCRHGLALLERRDPWALFVWDLVTGDQQYLPLPPAPTGKGVWNGAVLRHGSDRRSCPFLVAYVCSSYSTDDVVVTCACVYSSETGLWSEVASLAMPYLTVDVKPTALVAGSKLYWLSDNCTIVQFDLDNRRLALTESIPYDALCSYGWQILLMPTEDGLLGFAGVQGFDLHLWSIVKSVDGVVTWTPQRVIDLKKFIAPEVLAMCTARVEPIGYAEDAGVIFIYMDCIVYMIHLKSMQIKVVSQKGTYCSLYPYTSFYSPGITIRGGDDQAELLNNS